MNSKEIKSLTKEVVKLSIDIGKWMKNRSVSSDEIERKGRNDFVSYVDKEAERRFVKGLSDLLPKAGFIVEEGTTDKKGDKYNWVVDPLDGTTNFLHDLPFYCTSVALIEGDENVLLGVIYSPRTEELFAASKGNGAELNGNEIKVSQNQALSDSLVATGFPYHSFEKLDLYMNLLTHFTRSTHGIRRLGSAALDLAYVACGRLETFYEVGLKPWDVAAGKLIIEESGGKVTAFKDDNSPIFSGEILSSNGHVHKEMLENIGKFYLSNSD